MTLKKAAETVEALFCTQDATGARTDADSTPTGALYRAGVVTAASVTVSNLSTGRYRAAVTVPAGGSDGDDLSLVISATVSTVTQDAVVWYGVQVSERAADLTDEVLAGAGAVAHTITATVGGDPVDNVKVWVTSADGDGADTGNVVAGVLTTDSDGEVVFNLDASTVYWVHFERAGYSWDATTFTTDAS